MEKTLSTNKERTMVTDCCETALLAVLIAVSGTFRIPGIVPGTEFQLSAPIAVAICGLRYHYRNDHRRRSGFSYGPFPGHLHHSECGHPDVLPSGGRCLLASFGI